MSISRRSRSKMHTGSKKKKQLKKCFKILQPKQKSEYSKCNELTMVRRGSEFVCVGSVVVFQENKIIIIIIIIIISADFFFNFFLDFSCTRNRE
jgi:hypothetical protein